MQDIDRSYLSQPEVVRASRKWTCIRLATYENAEEAEYLRGIFTGRTGELENTVFAFMDPNAQSHLIRPGRGPRQLFGRASDMAAEMDRLASNYRGSDAAIKGKLPKVESLRLALNVAACEGLPVVVVTSAKAEKKLAKTAWSRKALGKAVYVRESYGNGDEAYVLKPDKFGMKVESQRPLDPTIDASGLASILTSLTTPRNEHRTHVREGRQKGVHWETKIPVTDPHARF